MLSKPVRYLLLCLILAASVCLLATAAGLYAVEPRSYWFYWSRSVQVGGIPLGISVRSYTTLAYGSHTLFLPLSGLGLVLGTLSLSALGCWYVAGLLARPLFRHPDPAA